jgi:anthranilate phosphoribosyltransferase
MFTQVLRGEQPDLQQGAFLAALVAKGETAAEIAGAWEAIREVDTVKVEPEVEGPILDNCGTGMDPFKTFNISTAASIIAAAEGVVLARHGARSITSRCGTVDVAEALGVEVEAEIEVAKTLGSPPGAVSHTFADKVWYHLEHCRITGQSGSAAFGGEGSL